MLIGAQMFTLRKYCTTGRKVATAFKKIKAMGYDGVQISAIWGKLSPKEMKKILDGEGLVCCATHVSLDELDKETSRVIDDHKILGCDHVALGGYFPGPVMKKDWEKFIARFNGIADKLEGSGMTLGYHNHDHEFCRIPDAGLLRPIDLLMKQFDRRIWFLVDIHWVAAGFAEPSRFIYNLAGRIPCIHFKDIAMIHHDDGVKERIMCEVGDGTLDWPNILDACRHAMVKWYIVERDDGEMDPFDSLKRSIDNMRSWGM